MKKGIAQFTAFCLAAGFTFSQCGALSMAAGTDSVLVGIGGNTKKTEATKQLEQNFEGESEEAAETEEMTADAAAKAEAQAEATAQTEAETETEPETKAPVDKSMVGTTGFASVSDYLTVRASGDAEGEVVGKVYNNDAVEIIDVDDNGWYLVKSGNVEGYVAGQFVTTGAQAEEIASQTGYTYAEVGAEILNVRREASEDSDVVDTVAQGSGIEVVEDNGDWVKVVTDDGIYGYVSSDFVATNTVYSTGETVEEEQARLDEQWLAYLAEQEAAQQAAEAAYAAELAAQQAAAPVYTETYTDNSYAEQAAAQAAADAQAQADAAAQAQAEAAAAQQAYYDAQYVADTTDVDSLYAAYVAAQDAADAAVANGADEQTIIDTAAAAQSAYSTYLTAQNAADAAAQAAADAQAQADAAAAAQAEADAAAQAAADAQAQAEAAPQETYVEETYAEETYAEDTYVEDTYVEETEALVQETSSVGQQIANYATQFVGNPYVWGGTSLTNGADCSGFVQSVYANFGISLPRTAASQSGVGTAVDMSNLQPGDLLFYSNGGGIGHVSMYIGGGQVVHASSSTTGIIISSVDYRTPVSARRLV